MTPYYILAVAFGGSAALFSAYALWVRGDDREFPGALYVPAMLIGVVFAVATLTMVVIGGNSEEHEEPAHEPAAIVIPLRG